MDRSKIEWTDASWTPIRAARTGPAGDFKIGWHCEHVSEGCTNCYAESINRRLGTGRDFKPGHLARESRAGDISVFLDEKMLTQPLRWRRPRMIFVCSMTDLFGSWVPDDAIDAVFAVMALCPQHTFQVLTKRPERARAYLSHDDGFGRWGYIEHHARHLAKVPTGKTLAVYGGGNLPNVWLGTSVEDQATADERIPHLLAAPAAVRFLSAEPLLGPLDLTRWLWGREEPCPDCPKDIDCPCGHLPKHMLGEEPEIQWLIVGGESGPGARPMNPQWARSLRDQCAAAGVAFFFKQWGAWAWAERVEGDPATLTAYRAGKKAAGRLLDGREHNEMPSFLKPQENGDLT